MSNEQVRTYLQETEKSLEQSFADLEDGKLIDMTYFDDIVRKLCAAIEVLPDKDAAEYEGTLARLGQDLEKLSGILEGRKTELKDQIKSLNQSSKANLAYSNTESTN